MVLIVASIICQVLALKSWYGCAVPDNTTVSDVYYEYSSSALDGAYFGLLSG